MFDSELYDIAIYPMQFVHKENEILKNYEPLKNFLQFQKARMVNLN